MIIEGAKFIYRLEEGEQWALVKGETHNHLVVVKVSKNAKIKTNEGNEIYPAWNSHR